jgi:hypothetical protein
MLQILGIHKSGYDFYISKSCLIPEAWINQIQQNLLADSLHKYPWSEKLKRLTN